MKRIGILLLLVVLASGSVLAQQKKITWKKNGSQVALIPGGTFGMGDHFNEGDADEQSVHAVELDGFCMDVHEVTLAKDRRCQLHNKSASSTKRTSVV